MKKGFTLVELLAVIVILAIIALIATPLVLKYINNSRLRTFETSIHNVDSAADYYVVTQKLKGDSLNEPEVIDVKDLNLDNKDKLAGSITIYNVNGKNSISYNNVTDGNYIIKGDNNNKIIVDINSVKQPILLANNDTVIIDSYKHYVYGIDNIRNFESQFKVIDGNVDFVKSSQGVYGTGAQINVKKDGKTTETYSVIIFGDVNGDGAIDAFDSIEVSLAVNKNTQLEAYKLLAADLNRNGKLDEEDSDLLRKVVQFKCSINQRSGKTNC